MLKSKHRNCVFLSNVVLQ